MSPKILSRRDLEFLLYEWLDVARLTSRERYREHSRETFDAALDTSERIATDLFLPHNRLSDRREPTFDGEHVTIIEEVKLALDAFGEAGLTAAGQDAHLGGMQLPCVVEKACFAYFMGANVATSGYPLLTIGAANLIVSHGTEAQIDAFARPMLEGRYFGTMCLSEPQAGSSLADITTRAEPDGESLLGPRYRLFGNKMWISGGEHDLSENIVHLVLAKISGGPGGTKGISLFATPKRLVEGDADARERNDVTLAGLNHKLGFRGTVNTLLSFGEGKHRPLGREGAVGYLVGAPHEGLRVMFHMMNEARIGVGLGAVALGYAGYLASLSYARERQQGRPLASRDPGSKQVPIVQHADVRRMLLAQKAYVEGGLALALYAAKLVDDQRTAPDLATRDRAGVLLDVLTPVVKSWPSQHCLAANDLAIQVHGGYGYTRDYPVEQLWRDNRLNAIHEGTHGIQAIDLLGRKIPAKGAAAMLALAEEMTRTIERARGSGDEELAGFGDALAASVTALGATTQTLLGAGDVERMLANASVYLEAFGHVVMSWTWLEQALACIGKAGDFYAGKRQACRYFFRWELPRTAPQLALLSRLDETTLDMRDAWF